MSILIDIIPASARKYVYSVYAFVGLIVGTLVLTPAAMPEWVATTYAFVGGALGLTAYANTGGTPAPATPVATTYLPDGRDDTDTTTTPAGE